MTIVITLPTAISAFFVVYSISPKLIIYSNLDSCSLSYGLGHIVYNSHFKGHLSLAVAAFNLLVQWHGLMPDENGFIKLSMAEFSLQDTSTIS